MTKIVDYSNASLLFSEGAAPATPDSATVRIYAKADGQLYSKDDAGVETQLGAGGGGGTGNVVGPSGATSGNLAVFDGTTGKLIKDGGPIPSGGGGITAMNEQTGTSYTLVLADATEAVRCTNSGAVTLTIPPNSSVAIPVLSSIPIFQGGAGVVTVTAGSGVTFESPNGVATTAIGDFRVAFQRATDVWVIG